MPNARSLVIVALTTIAIAGPVAAAAEPADFSGERGMEHLEAVCQVGLAADQNPALVKSFLTYAASDAGQGLLTNEGYVPISGDLLNKVRAAIDAMAS